MKCFFIFLFVAFFHLNIHAQSITPSILNATGGTNTAGGYIVDWSVGEMTMVSTFSTPSVIVTQGVLQPVDSVTATGINNLNLVQHLLVFPNPASSIVNLQYTSLSAGILTYRLMDISGKVIVNKTADIKQEVTTEQINISSLAAATYLLEVTFNANGTAVEKSSYKIQKLK